VSGSAATRVVGRRLGAGGEDIGAGRIAHVGATVRAAHEPEPRRPGTIFASAPEALLEHFDDVRPNCARLFLQECRQGGFHPLRFLRDHQREVKRPERTTDAKDSGRLRISEPHIPVEPPNLRQFAASNP
jgi:hypothetical protein